MSGEVSAETLLGLLDALLVAAALVGVAIGRRIGASAARDLPSAFALLDTSIQKHYPSFAPGYTWSEAFEWLRGRGVQADWSKLQRCLSEYEAYRYGAIPLSDRGCHRDIAVLAMKLEGRRWR